MMTEASRGIATKIVNTAITTTEGFGFSVTYHRNADYAEVLAALRHEHENSGGSAADFAAAEEHIDRIFRRQDNTDPTKYNGLGEAVDFKHLMSGNASPQEIDGYLISFDSYRRTRAMAWLLMFSENPERRLRVFLQWGNACDAPWIDRTDIAQALRWALPQVDLETLLEPDEAAFYAALPASVSIWRGCQRGRERGISWTTERTVAVGFAQGRRCLNTSPTLVSAEIPKRHILRRLPWPQRSRNRRRSAQAAEAADCGEGAAALLNTVTPSRLICHPSSVSVARPLQSINRALRSFSQYGQRVSLSRWRPNPPVPASVG